MVLVAIIMILLSFLVWHRVASARGVKPVEPAATSTPEVLVATSTATTTPDYSQNEGIKALIEKEFALYPKLIKVVKCESRYRQFNEKKNYIPLVSKTSDVGVMQVNQIHWPRAKKLGLDIFNSVEDNIAMGKIILKEQGLGAWYAPEHC